jgi:hypothetical protein
VRKTEGNGLLGKRRYGWENNIKMFLKDVGLEGVDWIDLVQVKASCEAVTKLQAPYNTQNLMPS